MTTKQTVGVPFEFFRKVRRDYRNWRFALVRELLQNSIDAGATNIHMDFVASPVEGKVVFGVFDNGCGMTEDVLRNKFLVLGASGKEDLKGAIGGFGMAKMVIFSCDAYEIVTGGLMVKGSGGEFVIGAHRPTKGTLVAVTLDKEDVLGVEAAINSILRSCWVSAYRDKPIKFSLRGKDLEEDSGPGYEHTLQCSGMEAFYNMSPSSYTSVTWMMKGLPMFTDSYTTSGRAVDARVDLGDVNSLEVFTTNRDGFQPEWQEKTRQMVAALSNAHPAPTEGYNKIFAFKWTPEGPESLNVDGYPEGFLVYAQGYEQRRTALKQAFVTQSEIESTVKKLRARKLAVTWNLACRLLASTEYAKARGVTAYYNGVAVDPQETEHALEDLTFKVHGKEMQFGFCFTPKAEGLYVASAQAVRVAVSPVHMMDMCAMDVFDVATHEMTHNWVEEHNADFCSAEISLRRSIRRWMSTKAIEKFITA